jgi:hypothetical protein
MDHAGSRAVHADRSAGAQVKTVHDALKEVLRKALPRMVGASVMVADELLEGGYDDAFSKYLSKNRSARLANFIVESKVLDGADESCFSMQPDEELAATRCEAKLHVLTPKELEELMEAAFAAGRRVEFRGVQTKDYWPKPAPGNPYVKRLTKEEQKRIEEIMAQDWKDVFDDFKPNKLGDKIKLPKKYKA